MAYPANTKTWQLQINQTVALSASATVHNQEIANKIKNLLIGFPTLPWTVRYSCNAGIASGVNYGAAGVAGDGVDRWAISNAVLTSAAGVITVSNDVNVAAAATRHSWIVLRQTGIATNFEICLDLNGSAGSTTGSIVASFSAGFTGGSATARPTATDEVTLISANTWGLGTNVQHIIHAWQSTDGACTRLQAWSGGTTNDLFLVLDKGQSPVSGWTNPATLIAIRTNFAGQIASSFANITAANVVKMMGAGSVQFSGSLTYEQTSAGALQSLASVGTAPNTFDTAWPVLPMGVCAQAASGAGRLCNLFDIWYKPSGITDSDTFPSSATARDQAALGGVVLPWTGTSTVPLIA